MLGDDTRGPGLLIAKFGMLMDARRQAISLPSIEADFSLTAASRETASAFPSCGLAIDTVAARAKIETYRRERISNFLF